MSNCQLVNKVSICTNTKENVKKRWTSLNQLSLFNELGMLIRKRIVINSAAQQKKAPLNIEIIILVIVHW